VGWTTICVALLALAASPSVALAQDNTGTNPANFTYDARLYFELAELDDPGGSLITSTYELRWPLGGDVANVKGEEEGFYSKLGKRFGARVRTRFQSLSVENPSDGLFGTSEVSGIGDIDARVLYMAYASKRVIVVPGLEAYFDTASTPALGNGANVLAPVLFGVFPGSWEARVSSPQGTSTCSTFPETTRRSAAVRSTFTSCGCWARASTG
jgi:hypothetical protein